MTIDDGYWQCPRCREELTAEVVAETHLHSCGTCGGVAVEKASLAQLLATPQSWPAIIEKSNALHAARKIEVDGKRMRYLDCPCCSGPTTRKNFERVSGIMIDICLRCGTWFDQDELRQVLDFLGAGGMERADKARAADAQYLRDQRRKISEIDRKTQLRYGPGGVMYNVD